MVAITRSLTIEPLFTHDLSIAKERVANIVHLIRLSGVLVWMGNQLNARGRPEFSPFDRYVPSSSLVYWYWISWTGRGVRSE